MKSTVGVACSSTRPSDATPDNLGRRGLEGPPPSLSFFWPPRALPLLNSSSLWPSARVLCLDEEWLRRWNHFYWMRIRPTERYRWWPTTSLTLIIPCLLLPYRTDHGRLVVCQCQPTMSIGTSSALFVASGGGSEGSRRLQRPPLTPSPLPFSRCL